LDSIVVVGAEKVAFFDRILPRFGNVHRHPANLRVEEFSPAVIAGDFGRLLTCRDCETDLKLCWNFLGTSHSDEEGMKIRAVALLGVAGIEHVAAAPSGA